MEINPKKAFEYLTSFIHTQIQADRIDLIINFVDQESIAFFTLEELEDFPENSICLIIKCQTMEEKSKLIQDEEFQKYKVQLESFILRKGASYESFTN